MGRGTYLGGSTLIGPSNGWCGMSRGESPTPRFNCETAIVLTGVGSAKSGEAQRKAARAATVAALAATKRRRAADDAELRAWVETNMPIRKGAVLRKVSKEPSKKRRTYVWHAPIGDAQR